MTDFMHGMNRKTVRANGIRLNVWVGGDGPALLLLHGIRKLDRCGAR